MAYVCEPHPGQQVFVDYRDGQTQLLCRRQQPGHQQIASSSFSSDAWTQPPELLRSPQGQFIQIHSQRGHTLIQIHPDGIAMVDHPTLTPPIQTIPLQPTTAMPETMPMPNQRSHRHTHQHWTSARSHHTSSHTTTSTPDLCPGCQQPIRSPFDRFCAHCGQKLG
jgi:hypothetical protein